MSVSLSQVTQTLKIMNMLRKTLITAVATLGLAVSSYATPVLYIFDDLGNEITINDNGAGDLLSGVGIISWTGTLGAWNIGISTTGSTSGSLSQPNLHLSLSAHSATGGFLGLYYADTDFGPVDGSVLASIGGVLSSGSIQNDTYFFASNDVTPPGYYDSILTSATYSGNPFFFGGSASSSLSAQGPFGLANAIFLTTTAGGSSSVDAHLSVPDNASTALLIGLGLLGIGVAARRKKLA